MRAGEINALTPFDINLKSRKISITKSVVARTVGLTKTKSSNRVIEMSGVTLEAVKRQLKRAMAAKAQTLFFTKSGAMLDAQTFNKTYWWPIFKKVDIRYRKCKTTRHTFISNALMNREDIFWVAKYVGHTNTSMIHKHYQEYIPDDKHGQSINRVFTQQLHNSSGEDRLVSIKSNI
jgi:integrase